MFPQRTKQRRSRPSLARPLARPLAVACVVLALATSAFAQADSPLQFPTGKQIDNFAPGSAGGDLFGARDAKLTFTEASFTAPRDGKPGELTLTATIQQGWYIYAFSQGPGGVVPASIQIDPNSGFRLAGEPAADPAADPAPVKKFDKVFKAETQTHEGSVRWTVPIELIPEADANSLEIAGSVTVQACSKAGTCDAPKPHPFTARMPQQQPQHVGEYLHQGSGTTIRGHVEPRGARPGETVRLVLTVAPRDGWHIYRLEDGRQRRDYLPTVIGLIHTSGLRVTAPATTSKVKEKKESYGTYYEYEGPVTWSSELLIPPDTESGPHEISGILGFQSCNESCLDGAAKFKVSVQVGDQPSEGTTPAVFTEAQYGTAKKLAAVTTWSDGAIESTSSSYFDDQPLGTILALAFLAGLILNVMPCVLPVIGLKVMAFVEQAGENRWRVFELNAWYSLGLMSVFMALATVAVSMNVGWGGQFESPAFSVVLAAIVFVFGLSLLGVWEIPIPGFVGSGRANQLAAQEGPLGAVCKGALTTVLATPCSGPFLVPAVAWAVRQPAWLTYATFGFIGLGMASPYLLIGAYPRLIRFLPKPGAWMETFKQWMGFILMGTVVWLLSSLHEDYMIPTLVMMVGLSIACWRIGRTPLTVSRGRRIAAWATSGLIAAVVTTVAFGWMLLFYPLPWQPFTRATLDEQVRKGNTVLVDFTADW